MAAAHEIGLGMDYGPKLFLKVRVSGRELADASIDAHIFGLATAGVFAGNGFIQGGGYAAAVVNGPGDDLVVAAADVGARINTGARGHEHAHGLGDASTMALVERVVERFSRVMAEASALGAVLARTSRMEAMRSA